MKGKKEGLGRTLENHNTDDSRRGAAGRGMEKKCRRGGGQPGVGTETSVFLEPQCPGLFHCPFK